MTTATRAPQTRTVMHGDDRNGIVRVQGRRGKVIGYEVVYAGEQRGRRARTIHEAKSRLAALTQPATDIGDRRVRRGAPGDPRNRDGSDEQIDMLMDVTAAFDMSDADGLAHLHRLLAEGVDYAPIRQRLIEMDRSDRWAGRMLQRRAFASITEHAGNRAVRTARLQLLVEGLPVTTIDELRSAA